jgi:hypothetical protein
MVEVVVLPPELLHAAKRQMARTDR